MGVTSSAWCASMSCCTAHSSCTASGLRYGGGFSTEARPLGGAQRGLFSIILSAASAEAVHAMGSGCGGRTHPNPWFPQPRAHAGCGNQAGRGLRRPRPESMDAQRSGAHWPPDTLSVAWLRGTFGRGAQASSAGFLHHMDWLEHVYTKVGPSGVPPPRARALSRECYAYHIRLFLGRLGDHFKDSLVSLSYPFPNS